MSEEPCWVKPAEIIELNQHVVASTHEAHAVLSHSLIESAAARPRNAFAWDDVDDVVALAVSLCVGVARNHGFEQGNKRTGWEAMILLLANNGYVLAVPNDPRFADALISVIEHTSNEAEFMALLEPYVLPID